MPSLWQNTDLVPTQQPSPSTKLPYPTPMYIPVLNNLLSPYKTIFINLLVQQSMDLLIKHMNCLKKQKAKNIYRVELCRAAGLPRDRAKCYLFQAFSKLVTWEITYLWNSHMDLCWVNPGCSQSQVPGKPLGWLPQGSSAPCLCALHSNQTEMNHKELGERMDSFENPPCVSNKKENPDCHKNPQ